MPGSQADCESDIKPYCDSAHCTVDEPHIAPDCCTYIEPCAHCHSNVNVHRLALAHAAAYRNTHQCSDGNPDCTDFAKSYTLTNAESGRYGDTVTVTYTYKRANTDADRCPHGVSRSHGCSNCLAPPRSVGYANAGAHRDPDDCSNANR
jgi:hypothetical protein